MPTKKIPLRLEKPWKPLLEHELKSSARDVALAFAQRWLMRHEAAVMAYFENTSEPYDIWRAMNHLFSEGLLRLVYIPNETDGLLGEVIPVLAHGATDYSGNYTGEWISEEQAAATASEDDPSGERA